MFNKRKSKTDNRNSAAKTSKKNSFLFWFLKHKTITIPALFLLVATIIYAVVFFAFLNNPEPATPTKQKPSEKIVEEEPVKYFSPLTGLEVASEADTIKPVTSVIIENTPAARPQSGLQEAEVVYEAATEAGITRFLVLYQQNQPELIGPVRSLRPFFVDYLAPYDAGVLHVGGSKEALDEIRNGQYRDLDQFFNGGSYWRSTDRYAPHNVYTNSENVNALNQAKGYTTSNPKPMLRGDGAPDSSAGPVHQPEFEVAVSGPTYNSYWRYDEASGQYLRSQAGQPHTDREKGQITAEVVVTLSQNWWPAGDSRIKFETIGSGAATIHYKGNAYPANWHKADKQTQYSFTASSDGQEIPLPRGKTWFTTTPNQQRSPL